MNKSRLLLAVIVGSMSFVAIADDAAKLKAQMQMGMDQYTTNAKRKNFKKCAEIINDNFAPDCKFLTRDGKTLTRKQWTDMGAMQLGAMKSISTMKLTLTYLSIAGNKATSKESFKLVGTIPSPAGAGKTSKLEVFGTSASNYEKRNGKWWVVKVKDTSEKVLIDGKAMTAPVG